MYGMVDVQQLLYGYYIKYDRLNWMMDNIFNYMTYTDHVDIYIDIQDILSCLYNHGAGKYNKDYLLVSSVINLAGHMRDYFWTRHKMNSTIYLIYGDETTMNHKSFYPKFGYKKYHNRSDYMTLKDRYESELSMIKLLCGYIRGVYYIRRSVDFATVAFDIIVNNGNNFGVVLTKSIYAFQLPAMVNNICLFRPNKSHGGDTSYYVDHAYTLYHYCCRRANKKSIIDKIEALNPELLSLYMTLNGLTSKGVLSSMTPTSAITSLYNAVINNKIINGYNSDMNYVFNNINTGGKFNITSFNFTFSAIDLITQHRIYANSAEQKDISWAIDLDDRNAIHEINNKYFQNNPLNLEIL